MKECSGKMAAETKEQSAVKIVRLAAFDHETQLSTEAAAQLLNMASDQNVRAHEGKELDTISEAELLSKLG